MTKLSFSGHDSFHCRQYWLKKGVDHYTAGKKFNDEAVVELGVGRNMVTAIRFWVNAFGLVEEDLPNKIARLLLHDDGYDPYIEDIGTLWLLHYLLVTTKRSSIYPIFFNEFRVKHIEFTKSQLFKYIERKCSGLGINLNKTTLERDINVLINNYSLTLSKKGIEETYSGLLYEIGLLKRQAKHDAFRMESKERPNLPAQIVLYCILNRSSADATSFSFRDLLDGEDSVGRIFALNSYGLMDKIEELLIMYPKKFTFTNDGGVQVLQLTSKMDAMEVLKDYYA